MEGQDNVMTIFKPTFRPTVPSRRSLRPTQGRFVFPPTRSLSDQDKSADAMLTGGIIGRSTAELLRSFIGLLENTRRHWDRPTASLVEKFLSEIQTSGRNYNSNSSGDYTSGVPTGSRNRTNLVKSFIEAADPDVPSVTSLFETTSVS